MSIAALLAGLAAVAGVFGTWDALVAFDRGGGGLLPRVLAAVGAERRRLLVLVLLTLAGAGMIISGPLLGVLLAAGAPAGLRRAGAWRDERRRRRLAAGLPTAARAIADALSGGHTLQRALSEAADGGLTGPAREELARCAAEIRCGAGVEAAIAALRERAGDPHWTAMASAIVLQRELGGDLAGLLRTVAGACEDAARAEAAARTMIAQARATAQLVTVVPVLAAAVTELARPGTFGAIAGEAVPCALLIGAVLLGAFATLVISRLARTLPGGA